ncbi:hypothetical protein SD457_05845 [Coprobacillaceae bacterium CR2/5/TPMF4]|nr:hypothetical protein SD457_05845 [Coprobacillaceae bacterium CR2/5/TPMF4]
MRKVQLGKTDMYVNVIGLGCMGLSHASGTPTPKDEAVEILKKLMKLDMIFMILLNVIQVYILMDLLVIMKKLLVKN